MGAKLPHIDHYQQTNPCFKNLSQLLFDFISFPSSRRCLTENTAKLAEKTGRSLFDRIHHPEQQKERLLFDRISKVGHSCTIKEGKSLFERISKNPSSSKSLEERIVGGKARSLEDRISLPVKGKVIKKTSRKKAKKSLNFNQQVSSGDYWKNVEQQQQ